MIQSKCSKCGNTPESALKAELSGVPFFCPLCGRVFSNIHPLRDLAFIWPIPNPCKYGNKLLVIPEEFRENYKKGYGILLALGPGYYKKSKFIKTSKDIVPGQLILYNKDVPWYTIQEDACGNKQYLVICGERDIFMASSEFDLRNESC